MKKTPSIIDTYYKSLGTKIFRDTTALPFADGGPLNDRNIHGDLLPSVYASALGRYYGSGGQMKPDYSLPEDNFQQGGQGLKNSVYASSMGQYPAPYAMGGAMNQYPDGGPIYTYAKRPGSYYQKDENGQWLISNKGTGGQYVPVDDPSGQRTAALNKGAVVYNQPVQEGVKPAPLQFTGNINQPVEPAYNPLYTNPNAKYSETTQKVASKFVPQTKQDLQDAEFVKENNANRKADIETFLTTQGNTPEEAAQIVGSYGGNWADLESKYANDIQTMNQTAATISQGGNPYSMQEFVPREAQSLGGKVEDMMFNPFTTAGYALRGQAIPDYMGEKIDNGTLGYYANGQFVQGRNMLDNVTDVATPIGWAHSAKNIAERATNDKSGDFWTEENAWDALNVLPGLGFAKAAKVARGVEAANSTTGLARLGNNVLDLAERAQLTRTKPQIIESAIDAGSIAREPFYAPQRPSLLNPSNSKFYKTEGQIGENTSTGLTNADIQREVDKNLAWINSDEYALRRSANTNESLKQVKKSVDKTIREAKNARFDVNSNMLSVDKDVQGVVTPRSLETLFRAPKVEIANYAFNPKGTLAHEVKHLYSPATYRGQSGDGTLHRNWWNSDVATLPANKRGLYADYPSLGGLQLDDAKNAYLAAGYEQQVRHLNAREKILGENKLPLDAKLDEDQVRNFVDNWADRMNQRRKSPNDKTIPIEDFDDIWGLEAEKIQKEMLMSKYNTDDLNYLNDLPTNQRLKFMDFYKDRLSKNVTDVLNKAWMTVPALGAGALLDASSSTETNSNARGGFINQYPDGGILGATSNLVPTTPIADGPVIPDGQATRDFYTNWYSKRTLPFDEIGNKQYEKTMKSILPTYNPDSQLLNEINAKKVPYELNFDLQNQDATGALVYNKKGLPEKIELNPYILNDPAELNATMAHEERTRIMAPYADKVYPAEQMIIQPSIKTFEEGFGNSNKEDNNAASDYYDYMTSPQEDNIQSMLFEIRQKKNLQPDQTITEEDIQNWKTEAEQNGGLDQNSPNYDNALDSLFKVAKDPESLKNLFNYIASNNTPKANNMNMFPTYGGNFT